MEKEVRNRIKSIIEVLVFLVVMTFYWYGPREDITQMAANVGSIINRVVVVESNKELELDNKEVVFTVTNKTNSLQNYEIVINSDYKKQRVNRCLLLSNNYLKYSLKTDKIELDEQNLSIDGIIYRGVLKPNEHKEFKIKMRTDKEDISKDECFYPVIKASVYNKI